MVLETDLASNVSRIGTLEGQIVTKAPIDNPIFTGIITGNGGLISNVTLEQVVSYGNTTSNTLYLTNEDTSLVTEGSMGVGTTTPDKKLHVAGDVLVDANVYAVRYFGDGGLLSNIGLRPTLQIVTQTGSTTDRTVEFTNVTTGFTTTSNAVFGGNIYVTKEITVAGNVYAQKDLEVLGNAYVSGNVNISNQLSVTDNVYISGNVEVTKSLIVSANTHLKGDNVFVTNTMRFLSPKTAIVTDQVSNVVIRLGQLENIANTASNPLNDQLLIYEGGQWANLYPNHSFLTIKNDSLSTMVSGNAIYISGYQNQNLAKVKLAKADSAATMPAIGIVYSTSIAPGEEGLAAAYGKVNQMNTNGYNVGETLYVSNLYAGWISNVKPYYTDSSADLIQNIGVVTRKDTSSGAMFVTGIGRANDIPNARIETSNASVNYVYVNSVNNDFRKIDPMKLPTKLQPLTHVVNTGNTAANAVTLRVYHCIQDLYRPSPF